MYNLECQKLHKLQWLNSECFYPNLQHNLKTTFKSNHSQVFKVNLHFDSIQGEIRTLASNIFSVDVAFIFGFFFFSENFKMKWVLKPPEEMRAQDSFNVSYFLQVQPNFYEWAVATGRFEKVGPGDLK